MKLRLCIEYQVSTISCLHLLKDEEEEGGGRERDVQKIVSLVYLLRPSRRCHFPLIVRAPVYVCV